MPATITSIAHYVPPTVLDNNHFAEYLDTNDEWITTRTGIKERRILGEGGISKMIVPAAKKCIEKRGISADEIDIIIVTTVTPDYMFPNTAAIVQRELGIKDVWGFDLSAACSGFLFGLVTACKLVESGVAKKLLLCGSDKMSAITNFNDRTQAVLFGDSAGVCLIEESDDPDYGFRDHILRLDGEGEPYLHQIGGGSVKPASVESVQNGEHFIYQDGQVVFKAAVKGMADVSAEIMEKNNLRSDDVAWLVPHQANLRIIDATARRMGLDKDKVMINIDKYGNTTSGTIPLCLSEWHEDGRLKEGDNIIISSFGAGYTWGAIYFRWHMQHK